MLTTDQPPPLRRTTRSRRLPAAAALILVVAACGGGSDPSTSDTTGADTTGADTTGADTTGADTTGSDGAGSQTESGDAATTASPTGSFVEIDGQTYEFPNAVDCTFGDAFWGPDFRRFNFDNGNAFPGISVGYAPPKADNEGVEDPNVVAVFPSEDPWWYSTEAATVDDYELTLTDDGAIGSATVGVIGQGGPSGEWHATFELSCGDAGGSVGDGATGNEDTDEPAASTGGAPEVDTGTVTLDGVVHELVGPSRSDLIVTGSDEASSPDIDFEICETVNPAFEGQFNVGGTLNDGTKFRLTGNINEDLAEHDGLFLGDTFNEERADDLTVTLEDRTLSGSATTSVGMFEFTFTC